MAISISSNTSSTPLYTQQTQAQPASSLDKSSVESSVNAMTKSVP
ncbi:hypothetical protein [Burkholderia stagnalis]|nr:hypothetical protein [Burkholderia stagnalis]